MTICAHRLLYPGAIDPPDCRVCNAAASRAINEFDAKWNLADARAKADYARRIEDAQSEWSQNLGAIFEDEIGFDPFEDKSFDDYPVSPLHMERLIEAHGVKGKAEDRYVDRAVNDAHDGEE